jgi:hypothetical protein
MRAAAEKAQNRSAALGYKKTVGAAEVQAAPRAGSIRQEFIAATMVSDFEVHNADCIL